MFYLLWDHDCVENDDENVRNDFDENELHPDDVNLNVEFVRPQIGRSNSRKLKKIVKNDSRKKQSKQIWS
jgi:hypothetical protein